MLRLLEGCVSYKRLYYISIGGRIFMRSMGDLLRFLKIGQMCLHKQTQDALPEMKFAAKPEFQNKSRLEWLSRPCFLLNHPQFDDIFLAHQRQRGGLVISRFAISLPDVVDA